MIQHAVEFPLVLVVITSLHCSRSTLELVEVSFICMGTIRDCHLFLSRLRGIIRLCVIPFKKVSHFLLVCLTAGARLDLAWWKCFFSSEFEWVAIFPISYLVHLSYLLQWFRHLLLWCSGMVSKLNVPRSDITWRNLCRWLQLLPFGEVAEAAYMLPLGKHGSVIS